MKIKRKISTSCWTWKHLHRDRMHPKSLRILILILCVCSDQVFNLGTVTKLTNNLNSISIGKRLLLSDYPLHPSVEPT